MRQRGRIILAMMLLLAATLACGGGSGISVNSSVPSQANEGNDALATSQVGSSRTNPAPAGSVVSAGNMNFAVVGYTRPATETVMSANRFNPEPDAFQEYIFVNLAVTCTRLEDAQCNLALINLKLLGSQGAERPVRLFVRDVDGLLQGGDFYGGATISGNVPFIIDRQDANIMLVYEPFLGDPFYLRIDGGQ